MEVTLLPIVILVKLSQSENAPSPMEVTLSGIVIFPIADGYAISSVLSLLYKILPSSDDE